MFDNFCHQLKSNISELSRELEGEVIGSEILLLALIRMKNSVCNLFLSEKNIDEERIISFLKDFIIIRKDNSHANYTYKFHEIIDNANKIADYDHSKIIYDEHLFYGILVAGDNIATHIIERFGLPINILLEQLMNIFDFNNESNDNDETYSNNENLSFLTNLTQEAKLGRLNPFIGRSEYIEKVIRIISKKQKNNPMLIGNAGVGKSALVEGVAMKLLETSKEKNIYRLDLGNIIAGTKYRGDLEERLMKVINKIKGTNGNSILFIDEIHNIINSTSSENTLDIANILKPILARGEIKCIGATTLQEYYKYIEKDKALVRRFQNIYIEEPDEQQTYKILKGIVNKYEEFYQVKYTNNIIKYIIDHCRHLPNKKFPDKAIDIMDEAGILTKKNNLIKVNKTIVDQIIFEGLGLNIKVKEIDKIINKLEEFVDLKKYFLDYFKGLNQRKTIVNISIDEKYIDLLLEEIRKIINYKEEQVLTIDLLDYQNDSFSTSLFGSPAGYVGYERGGILLEHLNHYPISIVIIKNFSKGTFIIKRQITNALKNGKITDTFNRNIYLSNSIFIFENLDVVKRNIGFTKNDKFLDTIDNYQFIDENLEKKKIVI